MRTHLKTASAVLTVLLFFLNSLFAKEILPKRELRGAWLATVGNIDWPYSRSDSDVQKQADLKDYMEQLAENGCNTVFFQVRCACDALYKSPYEPWSYWFTGQQGTAPSVDWDPLSFAIEEAHKLGLELHAWVNPYRAVRSPASYDNSDYICDDHVSKQHPDWLLKFPDIYILDPGLQEVRDYITMVLMDIVNRYDIDGLHMDDYFYPWSGIEYEDSLTFAMYPRGFSDLADWRRDNINLLVEGLMDSINQVKPWVKWGISPAGSLTSDQSADVSYGKLYADFLSWLEAEAVDYILPQCYSSFNSRQDYGTLVPWWAEKIAPGERHFYAGMALTKVASEDWAVDEIPNQVFLNRNTEGCYGSVFYHAENFFDNAKGVIDSLKKHYFSYPALWPVMTWKDSIPPAEPKNVVLTAVDGDTKTLTWDAPDYSDPADSGYAYVIYRSPYPLDDPRDIPAIHEIRMDQDHVFSDETENTYYYGVSTLDRLKLESDIYTIALDFVELASPAYAADSLDLQLQLLWFSEDGASDYTLELSTLDDFTSPLQYTVTDTFYTVSLKYNTDYFWRVKANNVSSWSPIWTFTTELAPQVQLMMPCKASEGIPTDDVELTWHSFEDATSYDLIMATDEAMSNIAINQAGINDTMYQVSGLDYQTTYYWRVRSNKYDRWSETMSFETKEEHIKTLWEKAAIVHRLPAFMDSSLDAGGLALGTIGQDEILLILQSNADSIRVNALDAYTGDELAFHLNLEGVSGGLYALRDIEISTDGVIYAANCVESGDTLKVYQWLDPSQPPQCVYTAEDIAFRVGDHITVDGRYDDGSVTIYAPASSHYKLLKLTWNSVSAEFEAEQISLGRMQKKLASVALIPGSDALYVNSSGYTIREFLPTGQTIAVMSDDIEMPVQAHSMAGFQYNDKPYLVSYSQTTESAYIVDVFNGVLTALSAGNTYKLGMNQNASTSGEVDVRDNGDGTFTIFVLGNQNGIGAYEFDAASAMVAVADESIPENFGLGQNYPNPFNPVTMIPYYLNKSAMIKIRVHDLNGRLVKTLYQGIQSAGHHEITFDASDLGSGMYIYSMSMKGYRKAMKLTLIK